jgi:hypothetical protein
MEKYNMKRKVFLFFLIALFGFAISSNFIGCKKKDKPKDTSSIEESSDDDISEDDEEEAD